MKWYLLLVLIVLASCSEEKRVPRQEYMGASVWWEGQDYHDYQGDEQKHRHPVRVRNDTTTTLRRIVLKAVYYNGSNEDSVAGTGRYVVENLPPDSTRLVDIITTNVDRRIWHVITEVDSVELAKK